MKYGDKCIKFKWSLTVPADRGDVTVNIAA